MYSFCVLYSGWSHVTLTCCSAVLQEQEEMEKSLEFLTCYKEADLPGWRALVSTWHPSQRHSILPPSAHNRSANRISRPPHYWEMRHSWIAGICERTAVVFTTTSRVGFWPVATGTPVLSSVTLKSPCHSSFPSTPSFLEGNWWLGNCALPDKWQDGTAAQAAHQQTAATEGKDGNKSPPGARITEQAQSTEEPQSTPREEGGKTSTCVSSCDDGGQG